MRRRSLLCLPILLILGGCHTGTLPNPNDPSDVGALTVDNIRAQLSCVSDLLQGKVERRVINNRDYHYLMQVEAEKLLKSSPATKAEASKAWMLADVMIIAHHWQDAKTELEAAIEWAKINHNEDRRVNDTLRLARVTAELGDVPKAIKIAREVFNVRPEDAVPILYATSSEIVPAARGKGHDRELADLLDDAIQIDLKVRVDPSLTAGAQFLSARPFHVMKAKKLAEELRTGTPGAGSETEPPSTTRFRPAPQGLKSTVSL